MSWKKIILDFINYAFLVILIAFCLIYFTVGDRIAIFSQFLRSLVPISYFCILFMVKLKISRIEFYRAKKEQEEEITLRLKYFDKFINEIIIFSIPIVVLGVALLGVKIDYIDIIQACVAFLLAYLAHKLIFKKTDNK